MSLTFFSYPSLWYHVESLEPEVKILSLAIKTPGRPDIVLSVPENGRPKGSWFTLKEGSRYSLQFSFQVSNNIVSGLKYTNTVWKTGLKGNLSVLILSQVWERIRPSIFITHMSPFNSGQHKDDARNLQSSGRTLYSGAAWRYHSIWLFRQRFLFS